MKRSALTALIFWVCCSPATALEPNEILVIANRDVAHSLQLARYYCAKRDLPPDNVLALPLGAGLSDSISRKDYEQRLAAPIREKLSDPQFAAKIKCLLTTYGVPIKVGGRGLLKDREHKLQKLNEEADQLKASIEKAQSDISIDSGQQKKRSRELAKIKAEIDRISGRETGASVDSELSMVLRREYELYRWQPNLLKDNPLGLSFDTLMVCRLDGPGEQIVRALVDKALAAEDAGLRGFAYIDSRGLPKDKNPSSPGYYDQSLRDLALLTRFRTDLSVVEERTKALFTEGSCPRTAIYCGWYNLKKYVDAFDFVDGAVGYHIASWEAVDLRDPNSTQWCPAMLMDGVTATLGAVAEPYLVAFPEPKAFFLELFNGRCLVEAYYHTKPFNSWQLVLIGDPLYRPFRPVW